MTKTKLAKPRENERKFAKVKDIIQDCGATESALIPILQKVQSEYRYLPQEILAFIATALDIAPATVYGVATFYAQFSLQPKGKNIIKVCDGTACHVRDNTSLINSIKKRLGLSDGKSTTEDLQYTLEIVSCIGACALAPAVVVNDKVHGQMTPESMAIVIDQLEAINKAEDN